MQYHTRIQGCHTTRGCHTKKLARASHSTTWASHEDTSESVTQHDVGFTRRNKRWRRNARTCGKMKRRSIVIVVDVGARTGGYQVFQLAKVTCIWDHSQCMSDPTFFRGRRGRDGVLRFTQNSWTFSFRCEHFRSKGDGKKNSDIELSDGLYWENIYRQESHEY